MNELDQAIEESGWDAEFLKAVGEIAQSAGIESDEDPRWELLIAFAIEADMQFAWVLYTRLRERLAEYVADLLAGEPQEQPERSLETAVAMARELYLPAKAGEVVLRELLLLGIRVAWDIPEERDG